MPGDPGAASRQVHPGEHEPVDHHLEGQREEDEVLPAHAQGREGDDAGQERGDNDGNHERQRKGEAEVAGAARDGRRLDISLSWTGQSAGPKGARLEFTAQPKVDPADIIRLLQSAPRLYKLDGPNRLRILADLPDGDSRIDALQVLFGRLGQPLAS